MYSSSKSLVFLASMLLVFMYVLVCVRPSEERAEPADSTSDDSTRTRGEVDVRRTNQMAESLDPNEQGSRAVEENQFARAEKLFRSSLDTDRGNLTAAFNLAGMFLTNNKEREAVSLLEGYATQSPPDAGICARLGDAYFSTKALEKAVAWYEKALELQPAYHGLNAKLGTIYSLQGRPVEAERVLLLAVEEGPKNARNIANLSNVFLANGKADEAVGAAKRALQIESSKELYLTLGNAYIAQRDSARALIALERAKDLGVTDSAVLAEIETLKKLETN